MEKPLVASYCHSFLKREMLHIYRQVTGLERYRTCILTKERLHADIYPFPDIESLKKPSFNPARHAWGKLGKRQASLYYRGEAEVLQAVLQRRAPALLHIYFGHTGVHLLPFIKQWQTPSIVSFHGVDAMPRAQHPNYAGKLKELLQTVPLILARSESLAKVLIERGAPADRIRINRTALPLDQFPILSRIAPANGRWVFFQAARLIEKKGIEDSLRAFAEIRRDFPNATFHLAGEGPLQKELEKLCFELKIDSSVFLEGFCTQDRLRELYQQAHVFIHPSKKTAEEDQEGIPNSMLEAMATGLPVLATKHGGIPEAVRDGKDGLLCAEGDWRGLAANLRALIQNPTLLFEMGESAAARVRAEFAAGAQIAKLESYYDEAVSLGVKTTE